MNITAVDTNFQQGVTITNTFGDGITLNSLTITSLTTATANITISNTTYIGYRTITMQTDGEFALSVLSPQNNPIFQIGANNAKLLTVSPNVEPQGWPNGSSAPGAGQITLTASGTHFLQNATQVSIGGVIVGDVNVQSPTVAVAQVAVPAGAPLGLQNVCRFRRAARSPACPTPLPLPAQRRHCCRLRRAPVCRVRTISM